MLERVEAFPNPLFIQILGESGRGVVGQVMSRNTVLHLCRNPATATVRSERSSTVNSQGRIRRRMTTCDSKHPVNSTMNFEDQSPRRGSFDVDYGGSFRHSGNLSNRSSGV